MRVTRASQFLLFVLTISTWVSVSGATLTCNPAVRTDIYVGDTASDAQCTFDAIQDAIDAVQCPNTWIILSGEHTYSDQHLTINNHSFTLAGGGDAAHCGDTPPVCDPTLGCGGGGTPALTTISGRSGDSVIHFEGAANVFLYNLDITGGNAGSDGSGGGVYFNGYGTLTLNNTTIENNEAGYGGGIDMSPSGGSATLTLQQNTLVINNTADTSGGGIRLESYSTLNVLQPYTLIAFNQANGASGSGFGGGVEVIAPAHANIGSPGYFAAGVISNNLAEYGGGIAVVSNDNANGDAGVARIFTTDPLHPVSISDNGASQNGGAVYLLPWDSDTTATVTELCAQDFLLNDNQAADGSAIYVDQHGISRSQVALNTYPSNGFNCEPAPSFRAVSCARGVACNQINANITADASGNATHGSTIALAQRAAVYAHQFTARENAGGHFLGETSSPNSGNDQTLGEVREAVIADNRNTGNLFITFGGPYLSVTIDSCTIANNTDGTESYLMDLAGNVHLTNSIVDQWGSLTLDYEGGSTPTIAYILSNDISTLQAGVGVVAGAPTYVDAAGGNYHLTRCSEGVDFAPAAGGVDVDGNPRDVDLPDVSNQFGPRDLGAYEIQPACSNADTIYCNGFEN